MRHSVVAYCNTSAAVKARAEWVVTSSNAVEIIHHLDDEGKKILWAPDRYLGSYLQKTTGADMILWKGACIVHEEFKGEALAELRKQYPLSNRPVVGSTTQLLKASQALPNDTYRGDGSRNFLQNATTISPQNFY